MQTKHLSFKKAIVENNHEYVSRPVRIKFRNNNEKIEGYIIFSNERGSLWLTEKFSSTIRFRFSDAQKTEQIFNLSDIDMIDYL